MKKILSYWYGNRLELKWLIELSKKSIITNTYGEEKGKRKKEMVLKFKSFERTELTISILFREFDTRRKNNKEEKEKEKLKIASLSTTIWRRGNVTTNKIRENTWRGGLALKRKKGIEIETSSIHDDLEEEQRAYVAIARGGKFHLVEAIFSPISSLPFPF